MYLDIYDKLYSYSFTNERDINEDMKEGLETVYYPSSYFTNKELDDFICEGDRFKVISKKKQEK